MQYTIEELLPPSFRNHHTAEYPARSYFAFFFLPSFPFLLFFFFCGFFFALFYLGRNPPKKHHRSQKRSFFLKIFFFLFFRLSLPLFPSLRWLSCPSFSILPHIHGISSCLSARHSSMGNVFFRVLFRSDFCF